MGDRTDTDEVIHADFGLVGALELLKPSKDPIVTRR